MAGRSTEVIIEQVLNKILDSKSIQIIADYGLDADYFPGYEDEFLFLMDYHEKYNEVPSKLTFIDSFPEFNVFQVDEPIQYLYDTLFELYSYNFFSKNWADIRETFLDSPLEGIEQFKHFINDFPTQSGDTGFNIIKQAAERLNKLNEKKDNKRGFCIKTGFDEIDAEINGWNRGEELVIFFGRTGAGKSWCLFKTLVSACLAGNRVGLISPEMSPLKVGYRFDTLNKGFSNYSLTSTKITEDGGYEDYKSYIDELISSDDFFDVSTMKDFNRKITVSKLRRYCLKNKLDILAIDGIKYLEDERRKRGDNTSTALTQISEDLMILSVELGIPIIVSVQANRGGAKSQDEDGLPEIENIKDSDGISHSSSKIFSIRQREDRLEIQLKKHRDGKDGQMFTYYCNFDVGEFKFEGVSEAKRLPNRQQQNRELPPGRNRENRVDNENNQSSRRERRHGKAKDF